MRYVVQARTYKMENTREISADIPEGRLKTNTMRGGHYVKLLIVSSDG
jgi:hypothetical protein